MMKYSFFLVLLITLLMSAGCVNELKSNNPAWTELNSSAGWPARGGLTGVVAMPDGSIVLMGGENNGTISRFLNDVWRSTDNGVTWTQQTANATWSGRDNFPGIVSTDGSIIVAGGYAIGTGGYANDTWRSTDKGVTWVQVNTNSGWSARWGHGGVAMPDGSILIMGGGVGPHGYPIPSDVWRSTDKGATWTEINSSPGWSPRRNFATALLPDGNIVIMGGMINSSDQDSNETWKSTDRGLTWTLINTSSGWLPRRALSDAVLPDGSIFLMGGRYTLKNIYLNDTWKSTDEGATWSLVNVSSGWNERYSQHSMAMPDGSIILLGGMNDDTNYRNDTWRLQPMGFSRFPLNFQKNSIVVLFPVRNYLFVPAQKSFHL